MWRRREPPARDNKHSQTATEAEADGSKDRDDAYWRQNLTTKQVRSCIVLNAG
jgi:hypothetical protein